MTLKLERSQRAETRKPKSRTDWARVDLLTDKEIEAAMASDPGAAPILTEEWFREAQLKPPLIKRGVFLRLDPDMVAWFKAAGPGYQTRMNRVLRAYMLAHKKAVGSKKAVSGKKATRG